jgi:hypothetical protein
VLVRERDEREDVEELFQRSERERESVRDATLQRVEEIAAKDAMMSSIVERKIWSSSSKF